LGRSWQAYRPPNHGPEQDEKARGRNNAQTGRLGHERERQRLRMGMRMTMGMFMGAALDVGGKFDHARKLLCYNIRVKRGETVAKRAIR